MTKTIGSIIRDLRIARNLTQEQLAENLCVTAQAVSKWENNITLPDISQVVPIAHFFGISTDALFGISENIVTDEVQTYIDNATSQDSYKNEYTLLKDALRLYPGDVRLLLELLSCGHCLLAETDTAQSTERISVFEECERAGKLILAYSKDLSILLQATEWLTRLYCEMNESEKAAILSESLPSAVGFNKESAWGRIFENRKEYGKARECYLSNLAQYQRCLIHSIVLCGNMYSLENNKKKARQLYTLAITLSEDFLEQNPVPANKSLSKSLNHTIDKCKNAMERCNL